VIAAAGGFVELSSTATFRVSSDKRILVAQYMHSQNAGGNSGDPALTLSVPTAQYRTSYQFHAPVNYQSNYVDVMAPTGAAVRLDGVAVSGFTAIGSSGFGLARVELSNTGTGDHAVSADKPVGVQVYGYGRFTSYWYPGGLELAPIDVD
jgi:hypothetical protein